jgi:hypothetical protein
MTRRSMVLYLVAGYPVGKIADIIGESRAKVRSYLKDGGIVLRPTSGSYLRGRDPVCASVVRVGYRSFHSYAQVKSLDPISGQASELNVTEKSLTRVYNAYQRLLGSLKSAGIILPTSQMSGVDVERTAGDSAS